MTSRVLLLLSLFHLLNGQEADLEKREPGPLHFVPLNQDLLANTPQMNYGQWIPIQQNPMRDDPTFEYLPPSLHTVYFGEGSPTSHPVRPVHPIPAAQVIQDDLNPLSPQFFNLRPPPAPQQRDKPIPSRPQEVISVPDHEDENGLTQAQSEDGDIESSPPLVDSSELPQHETAGSEEAFAPEEEVKDTTPAPVRTTIKYKPDLTKLRFRPSSRPNNSKFNIKFPPSILSRPPFRPPSSQTTSQTTSHTTSGTTTTAPRVSSYSEEVDSQTDPTEPSEGDVLTENTHQDGWVGMVFYNSHSRPPKPSDNNKENEIPLLSRPLETMTIESPTTEYDQDTEEEESPSETTSIPEEPAASQEDTGNNSSNQLDLQINPKPPHNPLSFFDRVTSLFKDVVKETYKHPEPQIGVKETFKQPEPTTDVVKETFKQYEPTTDVVKETFKQPELTTDVVKETFKQSEPTTDVAKETFKQPEPLTESEEDPKFDSVNESLPEDNNLEEYKAVDEDQDFPQDDRERDQYLDKSGEEDLKTGERDYFTVTKKDREQSPGYLPPGNNELLLGDPEGEVVPLEETDERDLFNGSGSAEEITLPSSDRETEQRHNQLHANKLKLKLVGGDRSEEYLPSATTTSRYDLELTKSKIESHKHKNILSVNHRSTTTFVPKIRPFRPSRRPLSPALQSLVSKSSSSTPRSTSTPSPSILKFQKKKKSTTPRPIRNQPLVIIQGHSNVKLYGINAPKTRKPLGNYLATTPVLGNRESTTRGFTIDPYSQSDSLPTGSSFSESSFPLHPQQFGDPSELGPNKQSSFLNTVSSMLNQFFNTPKPLSKAKLKLVNRPVRQEASTESSFVVMSVFDKKDHPSHSSEDSVTPHFITHDDNEGPGEYRGHLDKSQVDWISPPAGRDMLSP